MMHTILTNFHLLLELRLTNFFATTKIFFPMIFFVKISKT